MKPCTMNTLNHSRALATRLFPSAVLLAGAGSALAAVHYVDLNSTNATPPYTNWTTAATNIQDAVDAAVAGDEIVVATGIYTTGGRATVGDSTTNRVAVDKPLTLRSVNGPQSTIIDGGHSGRCLYLTNGASLSGFTLTNGFTFGRGAGVFCESPTAVVSHCVISGNCTVGTFGGGAYQGTLNNCSLTANCASGRGGGVGGGGFGCTLNNCTLSRNSADAPSNVIGASGSGGGASGCTLNNCTLTSNLANGHGSHGGGASGSTLNNCIVYFNGAGDGGNYFGGTLSYCCTTPQPTNGVGNITNPPLFVDQASGNLRLQSLSPCINAGNNAYAVGSTDLEGNPRIVAGTVDIGAYEFQATVYYVDVNSANATPPYTNWTTAATNIQDAVDAARPGDEIVITNGSYALGGRATVGDSTPNRVAVDKQLSLRSVNGPQFTIVDGAHSNRCIYLTNGVEQLHPVQEHRSGRLRGLWLSRQPCG